MSNIFEQVWNELPDNKEAPITQEQKDTITKEITSPTPSLEESINNYVRKKVNTDYDTPYSDPEAEREDDVSALRKFHFGMKEAYVGGEEASMRSDLVNSIKYIKAEHPEVAAKLGIREKGQYKDPTDSYIINSLIAFAQAAETTIASSAVTLFGSEEQIDKWDKQVQSISFSPEWYEMSPEDRRKTLDLQAETKLKEDFPEFYSNPTLRESGWTDVGNFVSTLASPTTFVAPAAKTYKAAMAVGGLWGAYDAALHDLADKGKVDPLQVALGTGAGMIFSPVLKASFEKGGRYLSEKGIEVFDKVATKRRYNLAEKTLDKYEEALAREIYAGVSKGIARNTAASAYGLDAKTIHNMYIFTGRTRNIPKNAEHAGEYLSTLEERAGWWRHNEAINTIGEQASKWLVPIYDRMAKIAPKIAHELRGVDFRTHLRTHTYFLEAKDWLNQFRKLTDTDRVYLKNLLSVDSKEAFTEARTFMHSKMKSDPEKYKDFVANWLKVRRLLLRVKKEYEAAGYDFDPIANFFPRTAKFPKHMDKIHVGLFHKLASEESDKLGRKLTGEELGLIMRKVARVAKKEGKTAKSSGHLRQRTVDEVTEFLEPYYADPVESLHSYLRMAASDIERQRFFQKFGLTKKERVKLDLIDEAVPANITNLSKSLEHLDKHQQDQVADLLQARFTTGEKAPHRYNQMFKNMGYILTLFNPYSALTQLKDQAFSLYKYGIRETAKSWVTPKQITKSDLGLTDAMEELFANTTKTKRTMDFFAKWSGFNKIDMLGKETALNAALRTYTKLAKTAEGSKEISNKWGRYFEEDTPKLIRDLHDGNLSENVRLLLWHELADFQPIALSEMPERYLTMKNGRIIYMLKSFFIKQLSFLRRNILEELAKGNTTKGVTNAAIFAGYWNLTGTGVDLAKQTMIDLFAGTDTPIQISDAMVENTLQMIGINKYQQARAAREGPVSTIIDFLIPPVPFVDDISVSIVQDKPEQAWRAVPYFGPIVTKAIKSKKKQRARISRFGIEDTKSLSTREKKARKKLSEFDYGL